MDDLASITERLRLLGDVTRLRSLSLLRREELTVGEIAAVLGQGQSSISSHLSKLREAGLVQDRRDGTKAYYRMNPASIDPGSREIWELLEGRLQDDALLRADLNRMEHVVLARKQGSWVDRAAGTLDRRYVPGRSFESLAAALVQLIDLGDCVDMGSGDGALLDLLAPSAKTLICLDLHPRMIEAGRKRAMHAGYEHVSFLEGDMSAAPLNKGSADTVLFLQSLQYAQEPATALAVAGRLLRANGRCLVLTLGEHGDRRIQEEYGHLHPGFLAATLASWMQDAGLDVSHCAQLGYDTRSPQLPILIALGVKSSEGTAVS